MEINKLMDYGVMHNRIGKRKTGKCNRSEKINNKTNKENRGRGGKKYKKTLML